MYALLRTHYTRTEQCDTHTAHNQAHTHTARSNGTWRARTRARMCRETRSLCVNIMYFCTMLPLLMPIRRQSSHATATLDGQLRSTHTLTCDTMRYVNWLLLMFRRRRAISRFIAKQNRTRLDASRRVSFYTRGERTQASDHGDQLRHMCVCVCANGIPTQYYVIRLVKPDRAARSRSSSSTSTSSVEQKDRRTTQSSTNPNQLTCSINPPFL